MCKHHNQTNTNLEERCNQIWKHYGSMCSAWQAIAKIVVPAMVGRSATRKEREAGEGENKKLIK